MKHLVQSMNREREKEKYIQKQKQNRTATTTTHSVNQSNCIWLIIAHWILVCLSHISCYFVIRLDWTTVCVHNICVLWVWNNNNKNCHRIDCNYSYLVSVSLSSNKFFFFCFYFDCHSNIWADKLDIHFQSAYIPIGDSRFKDSFSLDLKKKANNFFFIENNEMITKIETKY